MHRFDDHAFSDAHMDSQLTLRLPADMAAKLESAARRMKRKRSDVVRLALGQFLEGDDAPGRPVERVRDLIGSVQSGIPDLGSRHREHLIARLRRGQ
ncbi:MAG: ribbon-helix-helix protein, CopG family [Burkholderiales bacterium]|jgi:hypothetical protein|nr:ribbon-helix-helix protein, CopG family [Burkholderiales bacterium]